VLIDAARDLDGAQLLIVGDGPLRAEIERSASQARLTGAVPHHRAIELLAAIDLLVLPSLTTPTWKEQFGHVLIEAMACAVPVIGSNSGAIPEVVGDAGLIVPEGDAAALRAAIASLQADAAWRAQLAQAGCTRALACYTHDRIAAVNVEFFANVLGGAQHDRRIPT
jgi:glycosyltransferase involved in cell wall biosynthesis